RNLALLGNTCTANYLGLCSLTLPAGLDDRGLPVGLMLLAPHGADERLLAVALACERVLGNARQRLGRPAPGVPA
ncbi:MAG: amidase family protein, partial [Candidatus Competibacterales bacterium]|nr:amidase family protein [Candidatus Competibacterales bacterium]